MKWIDKMSGAVLAGCMALGAGGQSVQIENRTLLRDGKPFFPLGLVFGCDDAELTRARAAGMNSVHQEYSMFDLFPDGPEVSEAGIAKIREIHEAARRNDMVLFPLLTGHYIPGWLGATAGPAPVNPKGEPVGLWFPHSMYNPVYRQALEKFWRTVMATVGDDDRVGAFVMWNEPGYGLDATEHALIAFRQAMRAKYSDIAAFNAKFGTAFADFDAVTPPESQEANRTFFYEWYTYNQQAQADFFRHERDVLKSVAPGVRLTNKHPLTALSGDTMYCNDVVLNAAYQDIYGCDFYGGSIPYFRNVMELARSFNLQGPVVSYETHAQKSMPKLVPEMAALELFAQVLGGCRGMFFFCAGDSEPTFSLFNTQATPPEVFAALTKLFHLIDDNQEIFAAPRRAAKLAVLLANPSVVHYGGASDSTSRDDYTKRVNQTYDLIRNQHFAADFISDRQFADKLDAYELIVIPSRSILSDENLALLAEFHRNGGKILAFGDSLSRNEAFEPVPPPPFLGINARKAAPWNRGAMRLTEVAPELTPGFRAELTVQTPEIVNPAPMEKIIPGYEAKVEHSEAIWLAANQDAYPSIVQSSDEQVVYCAFDSLYSEGLSTLLGEILTARLGIPREVSAVRIGEKAQAPELMSAISDSAQGPVLMLANGGPQPADYRVTTSEAVQAWQDIATDAVYPVQDGAFTVALPAYGYLVLKKAE